MSFPKYPAYKDSGVEWLSTVPDHWRPIPIKYTALQKGALFLDGDWIESKDISADGIRYITTGNVGEGIYKEQGAGFITEETFHHLGCTEVYEGDLLISRLNNPIGRACLVPDLGARIVTSVDNVIYRPDEKFHKSFLIYLFSSKEYFEHTGNLARGATMQRISRGLLGNIRIVIPPLVEQTQIAHFLDHETARIDALIEEQQRLIELLKEKRQAVISHAVTKGLDPSAPMKDSGVEWLGEVPAHWEVKRLKHLCADIKAGPFGSALTKDMYVGAGYKVYGQEQVIPCDFDVGDYYIDEERFAFLRQYAVLPGDILISCVGTFGKIAVVPEEIEAGIINPRLIRIRANDHASPQYLSTVLRSSVVFEQFSLLSRGGTMDVINIGTLSEIDLAVPPLREQVDILHYIEDQSRRFDGLMREAIDGVTLLQERRSALISAAVTGKVDLRGWQPPTSALTPIREQETV